MPYASPDYRDTRFERLFKLSCKARVYVEDCGGEWIAQGSKLSALRLENWMRAEERFTILDVGEAHGEWYIDFVFSPARLVVNKR